MTEICGVCTNNIHIFEENFVQYAEICQKNPTWIFGFSYVTDFSLFSYNALTQKKSFDIITNDFDLGTKRHRGQYLLKIMVIMSCGLKSKIYHFVWEFSHLEMGICSSYWLIIFQSLSQIHLQKAIGRNGLARRHFNFN